LEREKEIKQRKQKRWKKRNSGEEEEEEEETKSAALFPSRRQLFPCIYPFLLYKPVLHQSSSSLSATSLISLPTLLLCRCSIALPYPSFQSSLLKAL